MLADGRTKRGIRKEWGRERVKSGLKSRDRTRQVWKVRGRERKREAVKGYERYVDRQIDREKREIR